MKFIASVQMCYHIKLLLMAAVLLHDGKSIKVYVKPNHEHFCVYDRCDTLSGYIKHNVIFQNVSGNLTIMMVFLRGLHYVSDNLIITGVNKLFLSGENSEGSQCHIMCSTQAYFKFTYINTLEINNLIITNCGGFDRAGLRLRAQGFPFWSYLLKMFSSYLLQIHTSQ